MDYTVILPSAYQPDTDGCIESMHPNFKKHLLVVDNTVDNKGCSYAWNEGRKQVLDKNQDWLIILSAAIRFNEPGGMDLVDILAKHKDYTVIEAMAKVGQLYGWHLFCPSRDCLERVGSFDENFPTYWNDLDYSLRIQKAYNFDLREGDKPLIWDKFAVDLTDLGMGRTQKFTGFSDPPEPRIEYFQQKWNRHPGDWQKDSYNHPFNKEENSVQFWPEVNGRTWND